MTRVALVACDHGLGHVRRAVLVTEALASMGATVDLLAPAGAADRARRALGTSRSRQVHDVDFATCTTPQGLRSGDPATARWEERLPPLDAYDRVVCDTLPEILAVRPDAILLAQFLWHDVLDGVDARLKARAEALASSAPLVIGSEPFAMPAVRALPGFVPVGMHAAAMRPRRSDARRLLITGGTTPALADGLRSFVAALAGEGPGFYAEVFADVELFPCDPPSWLTPACHSSVMYESLAAAVVRPGLGTVTELTGRGVPFWCISENGNTELEHNARTVERIGAGIDAGVMSEDVANTHPSIDALLRRVLSGPPELRTRTDVSPVRFDGACRAAELILSG